MMPWLLTNSPWQRRYRDLKLECFVKILNGVQVSSIFDCIDLTLSGNQSRILVSTYTVSLDAVSHTREQLTHSHLEHTRDHITHMNMLRYWTKQYWKIIIFHVTRQKGRSTQRGCNSKHHIDCVPSPAVWVIRQGPQASGLHNILQLSRNRTP